jgi:hypothetical protein
MQVWSANRSNRNIEKKLTPGSSAKVKDALVAYFYDGEKI